MREFTLRATHTALKPAERADIPHVVSMLVAYAVRDTAAWQTPGETDEERLDSLTKHLGAVLLGTGYTIGNVFIRCSNVGVQLIQILGMQVELPQ